jgi:hypothetical protein
MMKLIASVALLLLAQSVIARPLYKCEQGKRLFYQADGCPEDATKTFVPSPTLSEEMKERDSTTLMLTLNARLVTERVTLVAPVLAMYVACAENDPAFGTKYAASYELWKQINHEMVARVAADPELTRALEETIAGERARRLAATPEMRARMQAQAASVCEMTALFLASPSPI